jgi:hypothetical protein
MKKNIEIKIIVRNIDTNQSIEAMVSKNLVDETNAKNQEYPIDTLKEVYLFCLNELEKFDELNK